MNALLKREKERTKTSYSDNCTRGVMAVLFSVHTTDVDREIRTETKAYNLLIYRLHLQELYNNNKRD